MSEYWKSTERHWCKHCKLFVKDTQLERTNHDLTPRHQGNLKRFVRDLHKTNEREVRDAQRAKDEVARLNGVVAGSSSNSKPYQPPSYRASSTNSKSRLTAQDAHKAQLQQLVDLGVSLPDEFRKELSMTGEWQTVSERIIQPTLQGQNTAEAFGYGVRKRGNPEDDDDKEEADTKRRRWETTHKTLKTEDDGGLDALLKVDIVRSQPLVKEEMEAENTKSMMPSIANIDSNAPETPDHEDHATILKKEPSDGENDMSSLAAIPATVPTVDDSTAVLFKKRTKKNIRQK